MLSGDRPLRPQLAAVLRVFEAVQQRRRSSFGVGRRRLRHPCRYPTGRYSSPISSVLPSGYPEGISSSRFTHGRPRPLGSTAWRALVCVSQGMPNAPFSDGVPFAVCHHYFACLETAFTQAAVVALSRADLAPTEDVGPEAPHPHSDPLRGQMSVRLRYRGRLDRAGSDQQCGQRLRSTGGFPYRLDDKGCRWREAGPGGF